MVKVNGKKILGYRKLKRLSQDELGKKIGKSAQYISKLERNITGAKIDTLKKLSDVFQTNMEELIHTEKSE